MSAREARRLRRPPGRTLRSPTDHGRAQVMLALALTAFAVPVLLPPVGAAVPAACSFTVAVTATPPAGAAPLLVHLNATVSSGVPDSYAWQFGDGSVWDATGPGSAVPIHRYANPGSYPVNVTVGEPGCSAVGRVQVAASPGALGATIVPSPASGRAPLTVHFDLTVSGGSGTYVTAFWAFGDGSSGSGFPVEYTYSRDGTFVVTVNVTDSQGHWVVASTAVRVAASTGSPGSGPFAGYAVPLEVTALGLAAAVATGWGLYRVTRARAAPSTLPRIVGSTDSVGPGGDPPAAGPNSLGGAATVGAAAPEPPPGLPAPTPSPRVQLTSRVILHIGAQGRLGTDSVGPFALTQAGMAGALSAGQNSLTNVLRRLVAAGVLTQDLRHVSGQPRRLRVYRLTERGESVLRDLRSGSRPGTTSGVVGRASPGSGPDE